MATVSVPVNLHPPLPPPVPTSTSPSKSGGKKKAPEPAKTQQEVEKEEVEDDTVDPFESFNAHIGNVSVCVFVLQSLMLYCSPSNTVSFTKPTV